MTKMFLNFLVLKVISWMLLFHQRRQSDTKMMLWSSLFITQIFTAVKTSGPQLMCQGSHNPHVLLKLKREISWSSRLPWGLFLTVEWVYCKLQTWWKSGDIFVLLTILWWQWIEAGRCMYLVNAKEKALTSSFIGSLSDNTEDKHLSHTHRSK